MKVFITGATGYIGKSLCSFLLKKGYSVTIMALPNEKLDFFPFTETKIVRANLVSFNEKMIDFSEIDYVIHMANIKGDYSSNILAAENLLKNILINSSSNKKPTLLFTSSLMAAGSSNGQPRKEEDEDFPPTPYGQSKKQIEKMIQESGLTYVILRPTAVIGGDNPLGVQLQKFINRGFIPVIKGGEKQKISFVHVDDVIEAIYVSINSPNSINEIFFLSSEIQVSQLEVLQRAAEILNKKIRVINIPNWSAKTIAMVVKNISKVVRSKKLRLTYQSLHYQILSANFSFICSGDKIEKKLGWQPQVQSLDEALKSMLEK